MYLSDMFVVAHKQGGSDHVEVLFDILTNLPQDFFDKMGGLQWLIWAKKKFELDKKAFFSDLERYGESRDWQESSKTLGEFMGAPKVEEEVNPSDADL